MITAHIIEQHLYEGSELRVTVDGETIYRLIVSKGSTCKVQLHIFIDSGVSIDGEG